MKLASLRQEASKHLPLTGPDLDVVILTAMPSIGSRCMVHVRSLAVGFDWEHGKMILTPETSLYTRDNQTEVDRLTKEVDRLVMEKMGLERQLRALRKAP